MIDACSLPQKTDLSADYQKYLGRVERAKQEADARIATLQNRLGAMRWYQFDKKSDCKQKITYWRDARGMLLETLQIAKKSPELFDILKQLLDPELQRKFESQHSAPDEWSQTMDVWAPRLKKMVELKQQVREALPPGNTCDILTEKQLLGITTVCAIEKLEESQAKTWKKFHPWNHWELDHAGPKWEDNGEPMFLIDRTTGERYLNESRFTVWIKCILLIIGTPVIHTLLAVCKFVVHFLTGLCLLMKLSPIEAGKEFWKAFVITPFAVIALLLSAIYGLLNPYDARKLYASFEGLAYGRYILAPCFESEPTSHFFGGNMNDRNAY